MLDSNWEKWAEVQHFATDIVSRFSEEVWVSGHSVGGTLAMYEAASNPEVDGMILFAPALGLDPALKYAGLVSLLGKLSNRAAWYEIEPDLPVYRYESFPIYSGAQTYELISATLAALQNTSLTVPVFMVGSEEDTTVDSGAILDFVRSYGGQQHTVWYSQFPDALPDATRTLTEVVSAAIPDKNILGLSHLGLMTPPSHDFYGEAGAYYYCGHYYPSDISKYEVCVQGGHDFFGEITEENKEAGQLARITWNPFYDKMLQSLDSFLGQVNQ
jgi:alpha-beta hydrolase superfamily lysophospholipase